MAAHVKATFELTHAGALAILEGAVAKALEIGVPQCIAVVDAGGNLLAFVRMDGAKVLSQRSATRKAVTAASSRAASGGMPEEIGAKLAVATADIVSSSTAVGTASKFPARSESMPRCRYSATPR